VAEREGNGRFSPGCKAGPGRPKGLVAFPKARARTLLQQLADEVGEEHWLNIVRKAIVQAEAGDRYAREWLGTCLFGKNPLLDHELLEAYLDVEAKVDEKNRLAAELLEVQKAALAATPRVVSGPDPIDRFCIGDEPAAVARPGIEVGADTAFSGRVIAADDAVARLLEG
jgi:hypothetical protein